MYIMPLPFLQSKTSQLMLGHNGARGQCVCVCAGSVDSKSQSCEGVLAQLVILPSLEAKLQCHVALAHFSDSPEHDRDWMQNAGLSKNLTQGKKKLRDTIRWGCPVQVSQEHALALMGLLHELSDCKQRLQVASLLVCPGGNGN